jgi:hypothetical protein
MVHIHWIIVLIKVQLKGKLTPEIHGNPSDWMKTMVKKPIQGEMENMGNTSRTVGP